MWPFRGVSGDKRGFIQVKTNWGLVQDIWSLHICAQDPKIPLFLLLEHLYFRKVLGGCGGWVMVIQGVPKKDWL